MTGEGPAAYTLSGREAIPTHTQAYSAPELERRGKKRHELETPVPVMVWVLAGRHGHKHYRGEVLAWTDKQVQVRYIDEHEREGTVWVWANAVTRTEHVTGSGVSGR